MGEHGDSEIGPKPAYYKYDHGIGPEPVYYNYNQGLGPNQHITTMAKG